MPRARERRLGRDRLRRDQHEQMVVRLRAGGSRARRARSATRRSASGAHAIRRERIGADPRLASRLKDRRSAIAGATRRCGRSGRRTRENWDPADATRLASEVWEVIRTKIGPERQHAQDLGPKFGTSTSRIDIRAAISARRPNRDLAWRRSRTRARGASSSTSSPTAI